MLNIFKAGAVVATMLIVVECDAVNSPVINTSAATVKEVAAAGKTASKHIITTVPQVTQAAMYCGPACVTMVAEYFGKKGDQNLLANLSSAASAKHQGTKWKDMVACFQRLGLECDLLDLTNKFVLASRRQLTQHVLNECLPVLRKEIDRDKPVILCVQGSRNRNASGHYIVVVGYDDNAKLIYYQDPTTPQEKQKLRQMDYKEFSEWWLYVDANQPHFICYTVSAEKPEAAAASPETIAKSPAANPAVRAAVNPVDNVKKSVLLSAAELSQYLRLFTAVKNENLKSVKGLDFGSLGTCALEIPLKSRDLVRDDLAALRKKTRDFAFDSGLKVLKYELLSGKPVVACCKVGNNRCYLVVIGYDDLKSQLYYAVDDNLKIAHTAAYKEFCDWWAVRETNRNRLLLYSIGAP